MMEKYGVKFYGFCVHLGTRMEMLEFCPGQAERGGSFGRVYCSRKFSEDRRDFGEEDTTTKELMR
jgi:hypothetical protein